MALPTSLDTTNTGVTQDAAEGTTTDSTTATQIGGSYTLPSDCSCVVDVQAVALKSDGSIVKVWNERRVFKNDGGTVTASTQASVLDPTAVGTFSGGEVTIGNSGASITTSVKGLASTTLKWRVTRQIDIVQNSAFGSGGSAYDPSALTLSLWLRAGYMGNGSWGSVASAGASGGRSAAQESTYAYPGTATLNGRNIADFTGAQRLKTSVTETSLFTSASSGGVCVLYNARSNGSAGGAGSGIVNERALICGLGGYFHVTMNSTGPRVSVYDTQYKNVQLTGGTSGWHFVMMKFDGTSLYASLDGAAGTAWTSPLACGNIGDRTSYARIGANLNADAFFDGQIAEIMCGPAWADGDRANLKSYFNAEYGLGIA